MTVRTRRNLLKDTLSNALGIAAFVATATQAADVPQSQTILNEVVVTGSRLKRADTFDAPVPIAILDGQSFATSGNTMLGDALVALPQTFANVGSQNTTTSVFNSGQSRVDLRGLSGGRTLVLVDGRRHLTGDFRNSIVDLNMIPSAMVERVEIISGGASAVYGSEAISGVVNILLRNHYDGIAVDVQGGISGERDGKEWKGSLLYGASFADGRGSFVVGGEAASADSIFQRDRDWAYPGVRRDTTVAPQTVVPTSRTNLGPAATFQLVGGTGAAARSITISPDHSTVNVNSAACRLATVLPSCQDPWLIYTAYYNQLQGAVDRHSLRAYVDFKLSDQTTLFADASFANVHGVGETSPPFSNPGGGAQMPIVIRGDNAYLNGSSPLAAQVRTQWTGAGLALVRGTTVQVGKFWDEFGARESDSKRENIRVVTGLRGDSTVFDRSIDWDVYAEYGRLTGTVIGYAAPYVARAQQAVDAVVLGGQIVCNDAAARALGCQPWDLLAGPSAAAVAWANATARTEGKASQQVFAANANTSLLELPAGPLALAVGGEYRKEKSDQDQDAVSASNLLFYNQVGRTRGEYHLREAYAEVGIPLLADLPGAHRLSIEMAGRYGDYSTVGGVKQWRLQTTWAPIEDLSFRASKSVAVRAPNITELFAPLFRNFTTAANDPCDRAQVAAIASDPAKQAVRIANCAAVIPGYSSNLTTGFQSNIGTGRSSLALIQGGFIGLTEESADTVTAGFVARPSFVPDLLISFDYWRIEIENAISTIPINTLLANLCYDVAQTPSSNPYCGYVRRDATGAATGGLVGGIIEATVTNQNIQSIETSGYDLALQYRRDFANIGAFRIRIDATKTVRWDLAGFPGAPITHYVGTLTGVNGAVPKYKSNAQLGWSRNRLDLQWQTRFQYSYAVSEVDPPSSRSPFYTGNYSEHDLRAIFKINEDLAVRAGIINVTDEHPPLLPEVGNAITQNTSTYDNRGRWFYAGVNYQFGKQ